MSESLAPPTVPVPAPTTPRVVVTDIDIPIGSMMVFMIRWAIASIPAFIVIAILVGSVVFMVVAASAVFSGVSSVGRLPR